MTLWEAVELMQAILWALVALLCPTPNNVVRNTGGVWLKPLGLWLGEMAYEGYKEMAAAQQQPAAAKPDDNSGEKSV